MDPAVASLETEPIVAAGRAPLQSYVDASGAVVPRGFPRVIVFYGPPCSGKSEYFASKLAKEYTRVSASDQFEIRTTDAASRHARSPAAGPPPWLV